MEEASRWLLGDEPGWWRTAALWMVAAAWAVPLYSYFGYPLLLLLLRPFRRPVSPPEPPDEELPPVTMVVAARNEEAIIGAKVRNFLATDYPPGKLKLVVGSDASDDATAERAREAAGGTDRVEVVEFGERRGKVGVLNALVPLCDTPVVVFSDANTMYEPDAVRKLVRFFSRPETGGVCGRLELLPSSAGASREEGLYWRYENFLKRLEGEAGGLSSITGAVFAVRKDLFRPLPPDSLTEDQELGLEILSSGFRIYFDPEAVAREPVGSLETEKKRRERISAGNFQALFRTGWKVCSPLRGFAALAYFSHKVLRWMVPAALAAAAAGTAALLGVPAGRWLAVMEGGGLAAALLPRVWPASERFRAVRMARYFLEMNWAVAVGFVRYLRGGGGTGWERTERVEAGSERDA